MSIAVIIPAYNSAPFLGETLQSVFSQTHPPDEILVIDDGSTDGTPALAESFGPKVRVFYRSQQRQASNRNFGAEQTSCEWLAFLDHDDLWEANKLERQLEELSKHPDADLCYSARINFVQDGDTFRRDKIFPVPPAQDIQRSLYVNTTFMPGSVLIRRSVYLAAGGFDPSFKLVEDWDLWLRLLHRGIRFAACPEALLLHRIHANMQSKNAIAALAEVKQIYRSQVLPRLSPATRWIKLQISQSGQECATSYLLREIKDPRYLSMMTTSILRYPLNDPYRYKVIIHMLFMRLTQALTGDQRRADDDAARTQPCPPRDGTRELLWVGLGMLAAGLLATLLLQTLLGGFSPTGAHTNTGWFALIVALMCLPFGGLLTVLGAAKALRNRARRP